MLSRFGSFLAIGIAACAGCSSSGDAGSGASVVATPAPDASFCDVAEGLSGETSESYVGSPQHLTDTESLLAVAPDAIAAELETFRDFLASGAIDSASDPESNVVENWPDDVQAAVADIRDHISTTC